MSTQREKAEKVWRRTDDYEEEKSIAAIESALEQAERTGYERGVEDARQRFELGFERQDIVQDILDDIERLKKAKP